MDVIFSGGPDFVSIFSCIALTSRAAASALQPDVLNFAAVALQQQLAATRQVVDRTDYTTEKEILQSDSFALITVKVKGAKEILVKASHQVALDLYN